jgi:hypothetical protein
MKAVYVTAIHIAMLRVQPNFQLMNVPVFTKCMHIMLLNHTTLLYILICNVSNNNIGNILTCVMVSHSCASHFRAME